MQAPVPLSSSRYLSRDLVLSLKLRVCFERHLRLFLRPGRPFGRRRVLERRLRIGFYRVVLRRGVRRGRRGLRRWGLLRSLGLRGLWSGGLWREGGGLVGRLVGGGCRERERRRGLHGVVFVCQGILFGLGFFSFALVGGVASSLVGVLEVRLARPFRIDSVAHVGGFLLGECYGFLRIAVQYMRGPESDQIVKM